MKVFLLIHLFSLSLLAMTGSTYDVMNVTTLDKSKINFNGQKIIGVVPINSTANIDLTLTDDHFITGASVKAIGSCEEDEVKFQVVSGTTVVSTFIDWYIGSGIDKDLLYPAKIPATLKLRLSYKNTCTLNTVKVLINYNLHKVLQ
jgi:hypothetical protein